MIVALRYDAMEVFKLLLAQPRIQLEAQAENGNTALMMAAFKNNKPAVLALLDTVDPVGERLLARGRRRPPTTYSRRGPA